MLGSKLKSTPTYRTNEVWDEAALTCERSRDREKSGLSKTSGRKRTPSKAKQEKVIRTMKSSQAGAAKKTAKKKTIAVTEKTSGNPKMKNIIQDGKEQVALRAYFISERRRSLGIAGDETSDWVQAEQELSEELKVS